MSHNLWRIRIKIFLYEEIHAEVPVVFMSEMSSLGV